MKLAFCIFKYFPYGGLERDFLRILTACQQHNHEIHVYTMNWQGEISPGVQVTIVPAKGWTNHSRCASFVKNLRHLLKTKKYDVIVGFNRMPGLDVCYAADICFEHNTRMNHGKLYRLTKRYKIFSELEHAVFNPKSKTQIMYIADQIKNQAIQYYGTQTDRFHLLTPGVGIEYKSMKEIATARAQIRAEYNITEDKKLILLVGSNFKLKGVDRALHSVAALPKNLRDNVLLWVFGKDNPAKYKKLTQKLGIIDQVKFMGLTNQIAEFLSATDLLFHPARREAAGMVIMDAIVCGCPVLATEACGFASRIKKAQAGLIIPNPFQQSQSDLLLKEMLMSKHYDKWQQNALSYAKTEDLYSRDQAVHIIEKEGKTWNKQPKTI
jgi:UDP-glucose:(heptosyl)LPS alpha-1,3-glucosyltransferase